MRVIHLNHSDITGGAARAAYRIHRCLVDAGLESRMWVNRSSSGDWTVISPSSKKERFLARVRLSLAPRLTSRLVTGNPILHSPAVIPSKWVRRINASDADVVHLHWVQYEMLSVSDIGRIEKPVVWTLHDMWAFSGAEHLSTDHRWRDGYHADNRPAHESGFDLNRWTWQRKRKHWQHPMHIVTPSSWLGQCVSESALMGGWPVSVVPNTLDMERWRPLEQSSARELLGLPAGVPVLLFGAMGGGQHPHKGFDLLQSAVQHLRDAPQAKGLQLVVFGEPEPENPPDLGFPVLYTGHLFDDLSLRALYSAADVFAIPSRQDNLPNTGVESLSCGTPVVAFDTCGLPDIVSHQKTGYLAKAFDTHDLAQGILWVLENSDSCNLGDQARSKAVSRFSGPTVAEQYVEVYKSAIAAHRSV